MPAARRDFLAAICGDPDDDVRRLAFADWLDENGDPDRAEFIRAQCELATLPPGDPARQLAAATGLANLQRLDLAETEVTAAGLAAVARSPNLPALAAIHVDPSLTPEQDPTVADLVARLGGRLAVFHDEFPHD